jgi:ribosomal protein S18 acetylase RimI-like enzyme
MGLDAAPLTPSRPGSVARVDAALRPAVEADAASIATLWQVNWTDGHQGNVPDALLPHRTVAHFAGLVSTRIKHTTVAELDGVIVGFITVDDDEVEQVYVDRSARGSGVADALLKHGEQQIATHHDVAWLAVVAGNARARRFYEKCGWHDAGLFEYAAEIPSGAIAVPSHRYEKQVRH